jgi:predicted dehydrogenase
MEQDRIGVGILGSGFMGRTWAGTIARTPGAVLTAIAGGRRAAGLAEEFGVRSLEPGALLADPSVDLIVVTTPPRSHVDYAIAAAEHGKHVLIEKPMANTAADCDRIVEAARRAGTTLAVVSQHRFRKSPLAAKRLIEDGAIGEVRFLRVIGPTAGYDAPDDKWKFDPEEQSAWADWAAHACDITRWLSGANPTLAYATARSFTPDPPPEQSIFAVYQLDSGAFADIWLTYEIPQPGLGSALQFQIVGSAGVIEFDSYGEVRLGDASGWRTVYQQPEFDPTDPMNPVRLQAYGDELADVIAAIREGREPQMNGTEGRITIEMVEAGERAIKSGRAVPLPLAN